MNLLSIENVLKDVYLSVLTDQLNSKIDYLWNKIEHTTSDIWGKYIIKNVTINGKDFMFKEELQTLCVSIEITDKAIRVGETSTGALVNLLNSEMENLLKETSYRLVNALYNEDKKPSHMPSSIIYNPLTICGFKALFDTKKEFLYGCRRADFPELNPVLKDLSSLDIVKLQELIDTYNDTADLIVCSSAIKRKYMQYCTDKNQPIEIVDVDGGFKAILCNGIPMIANNILANNEMYVIDTKDFKFHQLCDWQWLTNENDKILRQSITEPVYNASLVKYGNLICDKPYRQIKVTIGDV